MAAAAILVRLAFLGAVALLAVRAGGERREAALDTLLHPAVRRLTRTELAVVTALPHALLRARRPPAAGEFSYHAASREPVLAATLVPLIAGATVALVLVVPWFWLDVALATVAAYAAVWLAGLAVGGRSRPHRLAGGVLEVRAAQLYRARVPVGSIASAERVHERRGRGHRVELVDGGARLLRDGRVDVVLTLSEPAVLERPLGGPVSVTRLAFAADDPDALLATLARERTSAPEPDK